VAHAHKKIRLYERADSNTKAGKDLRAVLKDDACADLFDDLPRLDYPKLIANLQSMLAEPDFQPIEQEWQAIKARSKGKQDPEWFSLFGGPHKVRDLAIRVKWAGMYEFLYRMWSNEVHAGRAMEYIGRRNGVTVMRPIRHPEELQQVLVHAVNIALMVARTVLAAYTPEKLDWFKMNYIQKFQKRATELRTKKIINAPWHD
jgi:hypothetical protein